MYAFDKTLETAVLVTCSMLDSSCGRW